MLSLRLAGFPLAIMVLLSCGHTAAVGAPVPDGPRLGFTALSALAPKGFTVRAVGLDSSRPRVVVRGSPGGVAPIPFSGLAWSADGRRFAFAGSKGSRSGIYTANADGSGMRFLRGTRNGRNPVFSPDGRLLAFSRDGSTFDFLKTTPWVVRVNGGGSRRLADGRKGVEYRPSSFSPDGTSLAVTKAELGQDRSRALLFKVDGSDSGKPLVRFAASDPVFSPDGSRIALVRHVSPRGAETPNKDLFLVRPNGSGLKRITSTRSVAETNPSWDPSGQRIAFSSYRISRDLFEAIFDELLPFGNSIVQINADGTCREKLVSLHDAATFSARWQPGPGRGGGRIECGSPPAPGPVPAGPRLAVVKVDLSLLRSDLETVDETGAQPLRLAGGGELKRPLPEWFEAPSWSPDGSRIVFSGLARSLGKGPRGTRLYVVGADGRGLRPLPGTHGAKTPVFTADGSAVAFSRLRYRPKVNRLGKKEFFARGASIWLVDLSGGAPRRITPNRGRLFLFPASFSPDGETLLATRFVGRRQGEVVSIGIGTGRVDLLVRQAAEPVFSPDATKIALVRWRPLKLRDGATTVTSDLFTVGADGKGLRRLTRTKHRDEIYPSWNPSGERLAFVRNPPTIDKLTELDEIGAGGKILQMNADGSCQRQVLGREPRTILFGAVWQPGPGREAGRIEC